MDRIKRLSYELLDDHKSKFGEDFANNKKILDQVAIIRSKGLKNEIAGYITKFIKKEIREEKSKQSQIESAKAENSIFEEKISVVDDNEDLQEQQIVETFSDTEKSETT